MYSILGALAGWEPSLKNLSPTKWTCRISFGRTEAEVGIR